MIATNADQNWPHLDWIALVSCRSLGNCVRTKDDDVGTLQAIVRNSYIIFRFEEIG